MNRRYGLLFFRKSSERGILLIEVLITITILSVGLTLILQSLIGSLRSTVYTADYATAVVLLEDKMFDFFVQRDLNILSDEERYFEKPYNKFHFQSKSEEMVEEPLDPEQSDFGYLTKVDAAVSWDSGRRKNNITVTTFLFRQHNEQEN